MKKNRWGKSFKSIFCFLLAMLLALQGTEPLFVQAQEMLENWQRAVDFTRPEPLTEEEAGFSGGVAGDTSSEKGQDGEKIESGQPEETEGGNETRDEIEDLQAEGEDIEEAADETGEAEIARIEAEESMAEDTGEATLREPVNYYPLPEEPEGELIGYDEESRTYRTGEKQYTTVIGGYVGTFQDEEGKIQLVDNTLAEVGQKSSRSGGGKRAKTVGGAVQPDSEQTDSEQGAYQNTANDYTVILPKNITGEAGIIIEKEDYQIEVVPLRGDYSHSVVKDNAILYNQVYDGIDVQYTVLDNSIKEDIVLQRPVEKESYEYELHMSGLTAELKDNQVYLYPEGKGIEDAVYILEAPSMVDAAEAVSFHILMGLRKEEGRTIISVRPDKEWLASTERQYPVRIDPTPVYVGKGSFNLIGVEQGSPNVSVGDNNYPYVGYDDGIKSCNLEDYGTMHMTCRTYIKVNTDFSMIPAESKIDSAVFSVSQRTNYSDGSSQFGLYRVDNGWNTDITWKTQPMNHEFVDVKNASGGINSYINYDVKDLVNDWVQGTRANNGMVLKAIDEASGLGAAMQCEVLNNRNSAYGPQLAIQWSPAEDPYLRDMSIDDTTIELRPMTEKNLAGKLTFDAVFPDGLAKSKSKVEYYLIPDEEKEEAHHETDAKPLYYFPDSTEFNKLFPEANKYYSKDSNWQGALYTGLEQDKLYRFRAKAAKEIDGEYVVGKETESDSFVIYQVKRYDTFPKIANYYGVPLADIMKDNRVQDALVVANNTIFVRNPKTNVPYNPPALTDIDKMRIDGALMGRGLHCEFGFEPVNLNTGNFYMDQQDVSMDELGGEFTITRSYNSKAADKNSLFGRGWSFEYDQSLTQLEDGTVLYLRGDGSVLFFDKNEDGSYSAPTGYPYELKAVSYEGTEHDEIGWELKDADQSLWSFDKYGMLRFVTDVDGFKTSMDYDEDYRLTSISTASGKVFKIKQTDQGYIGKITLPDGNKISYDYDKNGNLVSYTNADGGVSAYQYDKDSRMISWTDANGNTVVQNKYDGENRVVEQTDANGNTAKLKYGKSQTITVDNEGNKTTYNYDDQYRTTSITYPDGSSCIKSYNSENRLARETTAKGTKSYGYDQFGNVVSETREDGASVSYTYNEQNKLTSYKDYNGAVTAYAYDAAGNLVTETRADGSAVTYAYDGQHRIISKTNGRGITERYGYEGANLTSYIDGEGNAWTYSYDGMNRLLTQTDPLGNTESVSYNKKGDVVSERAADGGITAYKLDGLGNIKSITDAMGNKTSFSYDAMYNLVKGEDAEGNTIAYAYDKNYNEIKETDAEGNVIIRTYDAMERIVSETNSDFGEKKYQYDKVGNLISYTDGEGGATISEYNVLGLETKVTDPLGNVTAYAYDANGNETSVTYGDGSAVSRSYDAMGRVISETDEMGVVTSYSYDTEGNLVSVTDDGGRNWNYEYDRNNRCVRITNPEGGVSEAAYDAAGRQISYTNEEGQTEEYTLDKAGRVLETKNALGGTVKNTYNLNGSLLSSTDANGNTTEYTYNGNGFVTAVKDPVGNLTAYHYDGLENISEAIDALKGKASYSYDSRKNLLSMTDAEGGSYQYTYDKNGNNTSITGPEDASVSMKYDAAGQLVQVKDALGLKISYKYDSVGRVISEKDNAGNFLSYTYDAGGNLTSRTDQTGRVTAYTYDRYGRLTAIQESDGSITAYEYDVMDRVVSVTDAEGNKTVFTYDKAGNQLSMTEADAAVWQYAYDKLNRVISINNPLGNTESYEYDANGNVLKAADNNGVITAFTYDGNNNRISVTDGNGGATIYEYDELNRLIKETSPAEAVKEYRYDALSRLIRYKDPEELIYEYYYDGLGNLTEEISPKGKVTAYTYDQHGNLLTKTDPKGNTTSYEMNLNDQVTKLTMPNEGSYSYRYDEAGRLQSVETPLGYQSFFQYDLADNIVKESNSLGQTTAYTYDRLHRMTSSKDAKSGTSVFAYDIRGNVISETDALGRTYNYSYDALSQLTKVKNPLGQETSFVYDPVGNLTQMTRPGGRITGYQYDRNYNLTAYTDAMGNRTAYSYDAENRLASEKDALKQKIKYQYDKAGRLTKETDKFGHVTSYAYDNHGNVMTVTGKTGLNTQFDYDDNDNLIKVTDAMGGVTTYGYDSMDQLISYTNAAGKRNAYTYDLEGNLTSRTDGSGRTEQYAYDASGRLTEYISPSGKRIQYDYDKLNQLVKKSYEDAGGEKAEDSVVYAYNSAGERVSMQDVTGKSQTEYDVLGRITKETNGSGKEVTYSYDDAGNIAEIGYPDGTKISYEYDLNDNLIKVTDRNGKETNYGYDSLNRITEVVRENGTKSTVFYDAGNHITKIVNICGSCGAEVSSYEYEYNAQGYVVREKASELEAGTRKPLSWDEWYNWGKQKQEISKADCEHQEKTVKTSRRYEYDDNWELIRCTEKEEGGGKSVHNYAYDKVGNRIEYERIIDGVTKQKYKYKYNDSGQLIKRTNAKIWGDPGTVYNYDEDGNLIRECDKTNSADPIEYEYTAENRLKVVKEGGTVLMAAMYDGDNNRVFEIDNTYKWEDCYGDTVLIPESQRTEDGDSPKEELASLIKGGVKAKGYTLTEYINDANREYTEVLAEYNADGSLRQAYTYGEEGFGGRLTVDKAGGAGGSSYYLYDGRNSVTGLLAETGTLTNSFRYDPYGEMVSGTADGVNYYGYRAESSNTKTGFQYLRARYYNPKTGNFVTEDTYPGEMEYPLTRNRYTYALNNPVNYADPSGHAVSKLKVSGLGAVMRKAAVGARIAITKGLSALKKNNGIVTAQQINSLNRHNQKTAKKQASSSGTRFQTTIAQRTAKVRARVIRELCSTIRSKINEQKSADIKDYRFGLLGNVGDNGCAAVAIYNANQILGINSSFEDVLNGFNHPKGILPYSMGLLGVVSKPTIAGGLMGGNPLYIQKYYKDQGYSATWKFNMENVSKDADAYITMVIYTNPLGGHYQAGEYNGQTLKVYNWEQEYKDFSDMYQSGDDNVLMIVLEIRK